MLFCYSSKMLPSVNKSRPLKLVARKILLIAAVLLIAYVFISYTNFISHSFLAKTELFAPNLQNNTKYILMWTHNYTEPFNFFKLDNVEFVKQGCDYQNCIWTNNKTYLSDVTMFDAVCFHAPEYTYIPNKKHWGHSVLTRRNPKQVFIFTSIESSSNYPICENKWNGYFNWTMTYKTDSDVGWEYLYIRDINTKEIIGPKEGIPWIKEMKNVSDEFKESLKSKTKAAAWFVSHCLTLGKRERYAKRLRKELKKIGLFLDTYGKCGEKKCPLNNNTVCTGYLVNDYYFYLSFENSISPDYTTEKLLTALDNKVVPVVWSGSNLSRFLPPGSYIDARKHTPKKLAKVMKRIMGNADEYASYFKWRNHYTYHNTLKNKDTHPLCKLCRMLNDPDLMNSVRVKEDIRSWWNSEEGEARCARRKSKKKYGK